MKAARVPRVPRASQGIKGPAVGPKLQVAAADQVRRRAIALIARAACRG